MYVECASFVDEFVELVGVCCYVFGCDCVCRLFFDGDVFVDGDLWDAFPGFDVAAGDFDDVAVFEFEVVPGTVLCFAGVVGEGA